MARRRNRWLEVEQQCPEQWTEERERRRTVFCDTCRHHVVNLSRLTHKEAKALVESGDITCASYDVSPDGTPIFESRRERALQRMAAGGLALGLAACSTEPEAQPSAQSVVEAAEPIDTLPEALPTSETQPTQVVEVSTDDSLQAEEACDTEAGDTENDITEATRPPVHHLRGKIKRPDRGPNSDPLSGI